MDATPELLRVLISNAMFNAADRKTAEEYQRVAIKKYAVSAPRLAVWMEDKLSGADQQRDPQAGKSCWRVSI